MRQTIAMIGAGAMGAGLAKRLTESGARVIAALDARSEASRARARDAGMIGVAPDALADADLVLSVVPPAAARDAARDFASHLAGRAPIYVDCNAVAPRTAAFIRDDIAAAGARYVDGGIIGGPPKPGYAPKLYVSGAEAARVTVLNDFGLKIRVLDGADDGASRLKMSYGGITKGITAIAAVMVTGAMRAGVGEALRAELVASQSHYLAHFGKSLPDMLPKAGRWVAEMEEIAGFLEDDPAGAGLFHAVARIYSGFASDDFANAQIFHAFFEAHETKQ
jgi:3-hydroxyisobutyrate dehydrogenase-like beta-hydroxyacid dehydrogenase